MSAQVDAAIHATEPIERQRRIQVQRILPTGRAAVLDIPADLGVGELLALVSFVATVLPQEVAKAAQSPEPVVDIVSERRRLKLAGQ